jgi:hypothetical protein
MATWADRRDAYTAQRRAEAREDQRRNALKEIFASAYEPGETTTTPMYGPTQTGAALPPVVEQQPGGLNMQNALAGMYRGGFANEAMQLEQSMQRKPEYLVQEIGAGGDTVQSVLFDKSTGRMIPVGQPRRKSAMPDWMMPGYVDAQRQIAEAKGEGKMSVTAQKELFEADETTQSASNVLGLLGKAKELNKSAMSGPYAAGRAKAISWLPGESPVSDTTIDLDNIMTGQALESLKLIFGGMPTEGERKILLDMQASVDKTPAQREAILNRATELAQRRLEFNKSKAESLRSGSYFKESPKISEPVIGGQRAQRKAGEIVQTKNGPMLIQRVNPDGTYEGIPAR